MTTIILANQVRTVADMLRDANMPADPFEATDILDACRDLGRAVVAYATKVRAHRAAMTPAWALFEASLDKTGQTPPQPPAEDPKPEPKPEPTPDPEPGGDQ